MISLNNQEIKDETYKFERNDLLKIQKALFIHRNLFLTLDECGNVWQTYSWNLQASWLSVPEGLEDIVSFIESDSYFKSYESSIKME